jgi:outer membrane protein assembly factor BamB
VADLDTDGRVDVVAATIEGQLHGLRGVDGTPLWGVAIAAGHRAALAVDDLDRDGGVEVALVDQTGALRVFDGANGTQVWTARPQGASPGQAGPQAARVDTRTWLLAAHGAAGLAAYEYPRPEAVWHVRHGEPVMTALRVVDLDADGRREIVAVDEAGQLLVLDLTTGTLLWRLRVSGASGIVAAPAFLDADGDGIQDIVLAELERRLTVVSGLATPGARRRAGLD